MSSPTYGAIILAAGEGSRLMSSGVPRFFKPLLQVDGKFLIQHSLDFVEQWGVQNKVVVTSPLLYDVFHGLMPNVPTTVQDAPRGVLDAILCGLYQLEPVDYVLILCSDNTYGNRPGDSMRRDFEKIHDGDLSAVTVRHFDDKKTRDRLTGVKDGLLWTRGTCDDAMSWIGPLVLNRERLEKYTDELTQKDVLNTQLLETVLNGIAEHNFVQLVSDCADWGVISNGKENIFA